MVRYFHRWAGVIGGRRRPSHHRFIAALAAASTLARIAGSAFIFAA